MAVTAEALKKQWSVFRHEMDKKYDNSFEIYWQFVTIFFRNIEL